MRNLTILTITNDDKFLSLVRRQFEDQVGCGSHMIVAATIAEACALVDTVHPRLIVLHWAGHGGRYEQLDQLLWTTTVQTRPIPILVIAERYRTDQATTMYRMGVTEYISRTHHLDQLGSVCASYLPRAQLPAPVAVESSEQPAGKPWSSIRKAAAVASHAV